jgi:NifB/MoaA-like Fe-S oxidoreductase
MEPKKKGIGKQIPEQTISGVTKIQLKIEREFDMQVTTEPVTFW